MSTPAESIAPQVAQAADQLQEARLNGSGQPSASDRQPEATPPAPTGYVPTNVLWSRPQLQESRGRECVLCAGNQHRDLYRMPLIQVICRLSLDERFEICRSIAEECIKDDELRKLLEKKPNIAAYDGFEPSGRMHIAQVHNCAAGP